MAGVVLYLTPLLTKEFPEATLSEKLLRTVSICIRLVALHLIIPLFLFVFDRSIQAFFVPLAHFSEQGQKHLPSQLWPRHSPQWLAQLSGYNRPFVFSLL